ncbi:hypothetical protein I79_020283 [Cricetulus griseus]|uniref:Uncharacterized protein n=1 Tax=Cricetulus griseus TaxID=10029 RepID=G3I9M9_CRIGR|nr:hypothetical protein I79_020283 [Cricetulus griseus]
MQEKLSKHKANWKRYHRKPGGFFTWFTDQFMQMRMNQERSSKVMFGQAPWFLIWMIGSGGGDDGDDEKEGKGGLENIDEEGDKDEGEEDEDDEE